MNQFTWYNPNYTVPQCAPNTDSGACADTQWWFWLTAAAILVVGASTK